MSDDNIPQPPASPVPLPSEVFAPSPEFAPEYAPPPSSHMVAPPQQDLYPVPQIPPTHEDAYTQWAEHSALGQVPPLAYHGGVPAPDIAPLGEAYPAFAGSGGMKKRRPWLLITALSVVVVAAATVGGLYIYQKPFHAEFTTLQDHLADACANEPSAEIIETLLGQAWYVNENTPSMKDAKKLVDDFKDACTKRPESTPLWVSQSDIDAQKKLLRTIESVPDEIAQMEEDAYIYADFSYAVLQTKHNDATSRLISRGSTSPQIVSELVESTEATREDALRRINNPSATPVELKKETEHIRSNIAISKSILETLPQEDWILKELATFEPVLPTRNANDSTGRIPVFRPDAVQYLTATDSELAERLPTLDLTGYRSLTVSNDSGGHPTFRYTVGGLQDHYISFQQVDSAERLLFGEVGEPYDGRDLPIISAYGNDFCDPTARGIIRCWARTADGRVWQGEVADDAPGMVVRGMTSTWLQVVANGL